jgi:cell division protein FtsZ
LMGIGRASGDNRALDATRQAIASPLLEVNINGAQGILFNIAGSANLSLFEVTEAAEEIRSVADPEANIIFGTSFDERLGDEVMITVIATGFDASRKRESTRRETGQQVPVEVHSSRYDGADLVPYGVPIIPERQPVPVPTPPIHRPTPDQQPTRRTYDDTELEIPSFLRRPPLEDRG